MSILSKPSCMHSILQAACLFKQCVQRPCMGSMLPVTWLRCYCLACSGVLLGAPASWHLPLQHWQDVIDCGSLRRGLHSWMRVGLMSTVQKQDCRLAPAGCPAKLRGE